MLGIFSSFQVKAIHSYLCHIKMYQAHNSFFLFSSFFHFFHFFFPLSIPFLSYNFSSSSFLFIPLFQWQKIHGTEGSRNMIWEQVLFLYDRFLLLSLSLSLSLFSALQSSSIRCREENEREEILLQSSL